MMTDPTKDDDPRTVQGVVEEMRAHYLDTGTYRVEDVVELLGDSLDSVDVDECNRILVNSKHV